MPEAIEKYLKLTPVGQALLSQQAQPTAFAKCTPVIHKGQGVSGAYLVTQGRLRVFTYTPQGSEATLYFISEGETCVLALNCLFNNLLYPAWVEAEAGTQVTMIPGATFRKLFETEKVIQDMTVQALSTLVFRLMDELEQIHSCKLDQRLASFLLHNASADGVLHMTQQEIASHLGTSREVIARLMKELVRRGGIKTGRGRVQLMDVRLLAAWGSA